MEHSLFLFFTASILIGFGASGAAMLLKNPKEPFLSVFLFSLSCGSIPAAAAVGGYKVPVHFFLSFLFLAAPSAFLYVRGRLSYDYVFRCWDRMHYLPFFMYWFLYAFDSTEFRFPASQNITAIFYAASICLWLIYSIIIFLKVLGFNFSKMKISSPDVNKIFKWIRVYALLQLLLCSFAFLCFFGGGTDPIFITAAQCLVSLIILHTSLQFYFNLPLFHNDCAPKLPAVMDNDRRALQKQFGNSKKEKSGAQVLTPDEDLGEFYSAKEKIIDVLVSDKMFKRFDLSLDDLERETGISKAVLSKTFNLCFGMRFQDFVNLKRIDYFKQNNQKPEWQKLSMQQKALECGFRSRTTFYRAFVRHTSMNPSEFANSKKMN